MNEEKKGSTMKEEQKEMLEELKKYNIEKERERKIKAELGCLAALATFGS